jgi:hypothetical protein
LPKPGQGSPPSRWLGPALLLAHWLFFFYRDYAIDGLRADLLFDPARPIDFNLVTFVAEPSPKWTRWSELEP